MMSFPQLFRKLNWGLFWDWVCINLIVLVDWVLSSPQNVVLSVAGLSFPAFQSATHALSVSIIFASFFNISSDFKMDYVCSCLHLIQFNASLLQWFCVCGNDEPMPNWCDLVLTGSQRAAAAAVVSTFKFPLTQQPTQIIRKYPFHVVMHQKFGNNMKHVFSNKGLSYL